MMQFGLVSYQDQPDYASSLAFIEYYKRSREMDAMGRTLLHNALSKNSGIGKAVLMFARLYFWGQLDIDSVHKELANKITAENYQCADVFEKQELFDCLGQELLSQFIGTDFHFSDVFTGWESIDYAMDLSNINPDPDIIWSYIPPPTGFFSVIENIVLAKFFCKINNKAFKLDQLHNWWRYPVPFLDLFSDYEKAEFNLNKKPENYITWDVLRNYFRYINPANFDFLKKFKAQEYKKIKYALRSFLDQRSPQARPNPEDCVIFVRGGDKIQLETIEAPLTFLHEDISRLHNRRIDIRILSDDHVLAESLIRTLGLNNNANLTNKSRAGYHLHASHSMDDVYTIINNYLILGNARYSISCPSSNIVNSAHWSNRVLEENFKPRSLPSLRYLYL